MLEFKSPEYVTRHFDAFVRTFVQKSRRGRWHSILELSAKRWNGISLARFKDSESVSHYCSPWGGTAEQLGSSVILRPYLGQNCVLLRMGHDSRPGASTLIVSEVIIELDDDVLEAVVSIIPGKLAIVIDHESNITICDARDKDQR
jgi:hypothetical protein